MKSFRRLSLGYFVALATAVLMTASAEAKSNNAIIRAIRGDGGAQVSNNKGQSWTKAKVGASLKADSVVKTAADSTVDLFLGENGPVVRVTEGTTMGIDKLDVESTGIEKVIETQLDLKNGRILGSVKKMAAASKYEVKTPVGVAGIRGTEYSINSRGQVTIISGSAMVVYVIDNQVLQPAPVVGGQTINPPTSATGTPQVTQGTPPSDPTLLSGITTNPDSTIQVVLQDGRVIRVTVDGETVFTAPTTGGIAPPPTGITQPNQGTIQGEREALTSEEEAAQNNNNNNNVGEPFGATFSF